MSSFYLRGQTWWGKSFEQGKMIRWSLKTASRAEAKRRIKLYDSRPREDPLPSRLKGQTAWDETASKLLVSSDAMCNHICCVTMRTAHKPNGHHDLR